MKFLCQLDTDATLKQIQELNITSNQLYKVLIERGATIHDITYEMQKRQLPQDAWEHLPIIGIHDSKHSIDAFVKKEKKSLSGIGAGALKTYTARL